MASIIANTYSIIFSKYKALRGRCPMHNLLWSSDLSVCNSEKKHHIHRGKDRKTSRKIQESGLGNETQHLWHSHYTPGFLFNSYKGTKRWPLTSLFSNERSGASLFSIASSRLAVEPDLSPTSVSFDLILNH